MDGINPLDRACKEHDILYYITDETEDRYLADGKLELAAMRRITAKDASLGERATAAGVVLAMKAKRALTAGGGRRKRSISKKNTKSTRGLAKTKLKTNKKLAIFKRRSAAAAKALKTVRAKAKRLNCCNESKKKKNTPRIIKTPDLPSTLL